MQSQLVCGGCRTVLLYPRGATNVRCAICNMVTRVPPTGMDMAQLICGGCRTLLMHAQGATSVRCSCCHTMNLVPAAAPMPNHVAHVNCGNCRIMLMYPAGAPSVKCSICHYITNVNVHQTVGNSLPASEPSTSLPRVPTQNQTVVVQNPTTVDESGNLKTTKSHHRSTSTGVERPEVVSDGEPTPGSRVDWVVPLLRLLAFLGTLAATLVMALNKETKNVIVATIGTMSIEATVKAKFQHTPAFVLHNLLMLVVNFIGYKFGWKGHAPLAIAILDLMNVAPVSGGESAAVFMGQLGRDGNSHARWNKICDKIESFCDRGRAAMIASLVGLLLMIIITILSIIRLSNKNKKLLSPTNVP